MAVPSTDDALLVEVVDDDNDVLCHLLMTTCAACSDQELCHSTMTEVLLAVQDALATSGSVPRGEIAWYEPDSDDHIADLHYVRDAGARQSIASN